MYFVLHVGENVPGTNNYAVSLELHIRFPFFYFLRALLVDAESLMYCTLHSLKAIPNNKKKVTIRDFFP